MVIIKGEKIIILDDVAEILHFTYKFAKSISLRERINRLPWFGMESETLKNLLSKVDYTTRSEILIEGPFIEYSSGGSPLYRMRLGLTNTEFIIGMFTLSGLKLENLLPIKNIQLHASDPRTKTLTMRSRQERVRIFRLDSDSADDEWQRWSRLVADLHVQMANFHGWPHSSHIDSRLTTQDARLKKPKYPPFQFSDRDVYRQRNTARASESSPDSSGNESDDDIKTFVKSALNRFASLNQEVSWQKRHFRGCSVSVELIARFRNFPRRWCSEIRVSDCMSAAKGPPIKSRSFSYITEDEEVNLTVSKLSLHAPDKDSSSEMDAIRQKVVSGDETASAMYKIWKYRNGGTSSNDGSVPEDETNLIVDMMKKETEENPPSVIHKALKSEPRRRDYRKVDVLALDPEVMAKQLTMTEKRLLLKITDCDILDLWKNGRKKSPCLPKNISLSLDFSNHVTGMVATEILNHCEVSSRVHVMKHFIWVAVHCFNIQNFNSLAAVLAGFHVVPIFRLRRTWKRFRASYPNTFQLYQKFSWMFNAGHSYRRYRHALMQGMQAPPYVPWLFHYFLHFYNPAWTPYITWWRYDRLPPKKPPQQIVKRKPCMKSCIPWNKDTWTGIDRGEDSGRASQSSEEGLQRNLKNESSKGTQQRYPEGDTRSLSNALTASNMTQYSKQSSDTVTEKDVHSDSRNGSVTISNENASTFTKTANYASKSGSTILKNDSIKDRSKNATSSIRRWWCRRKFRRKKERNTNQSANRKFVMEAKRKYSTGITDDKSEGKGYLERVESVGRQYDRKSSLVVQPQNNEKNTELLVVSFKDGREDFFPNRKLTRAPTVVTWEDEVQERKKKSSSGNLYHDEIAYRIRKASMPLSQYIDKRESIVNPTEAFIYDWQDYTLAVPGVDRGQLRKLEKFQKKNLGRVLDTNIKHVSGGRESVRAEAFIKAFISRADRNSGSKYRRRSFVDTCVDSASDDSKFEAEVKEKRSSYPRMMSTLELLIQAADEDDKVKRGASTKERLVDQFNLLVNKVNRRRDRTNAGENETGHVEPLMLRERNEDRSDFFYSGYKVLPSNHRDSKSFNRAISIYGSDKLKKRETTTESPERRNWYANLITAGNQVSTMMRRNFSKEEWTFRDKLQALKRQRVRTAFTDLMVSAKERLKAQFKLPMPYSVWLPTYTEDKASVQSSRDGPVARDRGYTITSRDFLTADETKSKKFDKGEGTKDLEEKRPLSLIDSVRNLFVSSKKPQKKHRQAENKYHRIEYVDKPLSAPGDCLLCGDDVCLLADLPTSLLMRFQQNAIDYDYLQQDRANSFIKNYQPRKTADLLLASMDIEEE